MESIKIKDDLVTHMQFPVWRHPHTKLLFKSVSFQSGTISIYCTKRHS